MEIFLALLFLGIGFTVARFYDKIKAILYHRRNAQEAEYKKCMDSPYYFFTTYYRILEKDMYGDGEYESRQVRLNMSEKEFNERMWELMQPKAVKQYNKIKFWKSKSYD